MASEPEWPQENPIAAMQKARRTSTMSPVSSAFTRGEVVYPYREGAVYRIDVPFQGTTHLRLQPGEKILGGSGLRPTDWHVQRMDGKTPTEPSHLLLTPQAANVRGQMAVITSRGNYYLDVRSHETVGLTAVSWRHPAPVVASTPPPARIVRTGYKVRVEAGAPVWTPPEATIWDEGSHTYFVMHPEMTTTAAPIVYAKHSGERVLVNRTLQRPNLFVVHRRAQAFEFQLGEGEAAEVVVVERTPDYREVWCPGAACPIPEPWRSAESPR